MPEAASFFSLCPFSSFCGSPPERPRTSTSHLGKWLICQFSSKVVLLKGAAYIALGLPLAEGRRIADIDILTEKQNLRAAERELIFYGWAKTKTDDYDQRYYREWMHEIPPLQHRQRGTVVDVHHNILPPILKRAPALLRRQSLRTSPRGGTPTIAMRSRTRASRDACESSVQVLESETTPDREAG